MNKQKLEKIQQAIEAAIQALENLEEALNQDNHRAVGAALYEIHRALQEAKREAQ